MIVGIVGSRTVGECSCAGKGFDYMRSKEGLEHRKECAGLKAVNRMRSIVGQLAAKYEGDLLVISGGAVGADKLAEDACDLLKVKFKEVEIKPGREPFAERAKARNTRLVEKADMLVAVFAPGPRSPGTSDTLRKAIAKPIPVHVYHEGRWGTE